MIRGIPARKPGSGDGCQNILWRPDLSGPLCELSRIKINSSPIFFISWGKQRIDGNSASQDDSISFANEMIWRNGFIAAIRCHKDWWTKMLPTILLEMRAWREDFQVTAAELVYRETLQLPGQFLSRQPSKDSSDIANYIRELHPSGGFVMEEVVYLCSRTWQCLVKYNICAMWEIESNVAVSLRWVVRDCELSRQNFCHAYARQRYHGSMDQLIYYIVNILYLLTDSTASSETQMTAMQS